jgi:hypothetical protein
MTQLGSDGESYVSYETCVRKLPASHAEKSEQVGREVPCRYCP